MFITILELEKLKKTLDTEPRIFRHESTRNRIRVDLWNKIRGSVSGENPRLG